MIPSIIQLKEDVKELNEKILRLESFILASDPECEECNEVRTGILAQVQKEHVGSTVVHNNGEEVPNGNRGD